MAFLRSLMVCTLSAFTAFALRAPIVISESIERRAIPLPSDDTFYKAPDNLTEYEPGEIIRTRNTLGKPAFINAKINIAGSYNILYRSNGGVGDATAAVTTIVVPHDADFSKFLSFQVEIDAPYEGCFPSYTLMQGNQFLDSISAQYGELLAVAALDRGWVVAFPDHEGPSAAFGSGKVQGYTTLDGIRAALASKSVTGIEPDAKVAVWGYSGGALATEWALEYHGSYAPELNITAGAVGGPPANVQNAISKTWNKGIGAVFAFSGPIGVGRGDPEFGKYVEDHIKKDKKEEFYRAAKTCIVRGAVEFAYKDLFSFTTNGEGFLTEPLAAKAFENNILGTHGTPKPPMYLYASASDELLPIEDTDKLYEKHCAAGANIKYVRESLGEHIIVALTGGAGAFKFLTDHMENGAKHTGCHKEQLLTSSIIPDNLDSLGQIVATDVKMLLGRPIGVKSWIAQDGKGLGQGDSEKL